MAALLSLKYNDKFILTEFKIRRPSFTFNIIGESDPIDTQCNIKSCPLGVPPASSIRACLGPSLAQVFFEYTHDDTKKLLDVLTHPKTPKTCYSIPADDSRPSTLPPSDNQIIKAFLHQNILELGGKILKRVEKEIEKNLREIIEKESHQKFYLYQAKKRRDAEETVQRIYEKYEDYVTDLHKKLQKQIEVEWAKMTMVHMKNLQKAVVQERINVVHEMMEKMRSEISYIVQLLYKDFEDSFRAQRETIIADFNQIMRDKHVKLNKNMEEYESKLNNKLFIQKHQLEMQNAAEVIYILCLERFRNDREKHTIHKYFEQQLAEFCELIDRLRDVITVMRKEIIDCHMEKKSLEEQLFQITKQFQKFIDFVFNAVPGQAEYLLPLEFQRLITSDKEEEKI